MKKKNVAYLREMDITCSSFFFVEIKTKHSKKNLIFVAQEQFQRFIITFYETEKKADGNFPWIQKSGLQEQKIRNSKRR